MGIADIPFSKLIEQDDELVELRRSYSQKSCKERREAADWVYHAGIANGLFTQTLIQTGQGYAVSNRWEAEIEALAIDPGFAPALLTIGSIEHQLGRPAEAMCLFLSIVRLPADTADLAIIADKAGTFLLNRKDYASAREFYEAACVTLRRSAHLLGGLAYSLAKLGLQEESIRVHRQSVSMDAQNPVLLSDLGWALTEAGQYEEAEQVLAQAVALAAPGDDTARNNLAEVQRRRSTLGRRRS